MPLKYIAIKQFILYNDIMASPEIGDSQVLTFSVRRDGTPLSRATRITTEQDHQFFDRFTQALFENGLNPAENVFSGFDGGGFKHSQNNVPVMTRRYIWAMDIVSWRKGLTYTTPGTAAEYADRYAVPCIGVYATRELRQVELTHAPDSLDPSDDGFELREPLLTEFPEGGVYDPVTHIDHPHTPVVAALRATVFLEYST